MRIRDFGAHALALGIVLAIALVAERAPAQDLSHLDFTNFESSHVRPLALSPDGSQLFAVNTPDNRIAVFDVTPDGLDLAVEVPVGLEPVALAARTNGSGGTEVWVVNHLSDSVSIVVIDPVVHGQSRVVATLQVGDEPRDIVFAGFGGTSRAFVTTARRGQNLPGSIDPALLQEGTPRALVWVFDANDPFGSSPLAGQPITILELFGDVPRALAASPDGATVYAGAFRSGNQTTIVPEPDVTGGAGLPPSPAGSPFPSSPCDEGVEPPKPPFSAPCVGLIVRFDPLSGEWRDELQRDWSASVPLSLPDEDVWRIDALSTPPTVTDTITTVGTSLHNMAVRPTDGKLFVTNMEARNEVRFEALIGPTQGLLGNAVAHRVSVVDGVTVTPVDLNPHVDPTVAPGPAEEVAQSLATPMGLAFSSDGQKVYVAGFGSGKVGVFDAEALATGHSSRELIPVGGGPTGVVLDEAQDRLFVMNRFEQRIAIVTDLSLPFLRAVTDSVSLRFDPSPTEVTKGRPRLYDSTFSAHGTSACSDCHPSGDRDGLAWDLGDPFGAFEPNPNPFVGTGAIGFGFHPMKGPMTTQSLRGLAEAGPMHWRGDRTGGATGGDPLDEDLAFKAFNPAFPGLLGAPSDLPEDFMQEYTDFVLTIRYPPSPVRRLDDVPTQLESDGEAVYVNLPTDTNPCNFCHTLPLGTAGESTFEPESQQFKVPHFRNMYDKVGMFGVSPGMVSDFGMTPTGHLGDQVTGFGYVHDGSVPTLFDFTGSGIFNLTVHPTLTAPYVLDALVAFQLSFDTGFKPAIGQQVTSNAASWNDPATTARRDLLLGQATLQNCAVVVKGSVAGEQRGAVYLPATGEVFTDRAELLPFRTVWNLGEAIGNESTWTCVPLGDEARLGVDRDRDGALDRAEIDGGADPADPLSFPAGRHIVPISSRTLVLKDGQASGNPNDRSLNFVSSTKKDPPANRIAPPAVGGAGDPTLGGGTLRVFNAAGSGELVEVDLDSSLWTVTGSGFEYRNPAAGAPIKKVVVKANKITVKGAKAGWPYTLNEARQGRMALRLSLGVDSGGVDWCAEAAARRTRTKPPTTEKNDRVDRFKGEKSGPPTACAAPPIP